jgi:peptide/nickel transport system permease protein
MTLLTSPTAQAIDLGLKPRARSPFVRKFLANKGAVIGLVVLLLFVLAAALAPWIAPYDPLKANFLAVRKAPSLLHWLGTDELGRDLFSRLLWGARSSLLAGAVSVAIAMAIGVPLGLLAGYFGGKWDAAISRIMEALLSCPFLVLAIALGAFLGPSLTNAMIAIGLSAMPIFARLTRGQVLAIRHEDYLEGARAIGLPDRWIILRYVLPNVLSPLVVQATLTIASAILAEAASNRPRRPGARCSTPRKTSWSRHPGCRSRPAWRSTSRCFASTCWAMACAMPSTRKADFTPNETCP